MSGVLSINSGVSGYGQTQGTGRSGHHKGQMFSQLDTNGDGKLDKDELAAAKAKAQPGSKEAQFLDSLQVDSDGSITKQEFQDQAKQYFQQMRSQDGGQMGQRLFSKLDANNDGKLDQDELSSMASRTGQSTSDLLKAMDSDGDGSVSQSEFQNYMSQMYNKNGATGATASTATGTSSDATTASDDTTNATASAPTVVQAYTQASDNIYSSAQASENQALLASGLYA